MLLRLCTLVLIACLSVPAVAGTTYKCTATNGKVVYQDRPCPAGQHQEALQLDESVPVTPPPPPAPPPVITPAEPPPPPVPFEPPVPLPVMYACQRATDGKTYLSEHGDPQPHQVPYGILGAGSLPLSQAYGPPNGAGASAPELNRGRVRPGMIANYYVWVQDQCRELTRDETCHALRDAFDENATKLRRAFKSDQPPLEKREEQLREQLRNC
ncbi:DUF4124 domain-containing protein [Dyella soli]|uniref:DUF4124 domain-containing protein n=1 Tax=Dyella soli TaxID=522319 RepID=A0A4R0YQY7_9GAMM|nr:DUF4124 domain-containing protein [Dyella soli]TCI11256.1 DUF4124 domain-containing protein [Dyella soli]